MKTEEEKEIQGAIEENGINRKRLRKRKASDRFRERKKEVKKKKENKMGKNLKEEWKIYEVRGRERMIQDQRR